MTPALRIDRLSVSFPSPDGGRRHAVSRVSLSVYPRQTLAVVGESGSGKSVSALSVLRLLPRAARVEAGRILLAARDPAAAPVDILRLPERDMLPIRGGDAAMIFQEPMSSLNPVFTVGEQLIEAVRRHRPAGRREAASIAADALAEAGITDPAARLRQYPHEFSGGMRQRVMIAMALACRPRILLADEPTTALDVTVQAQILALLARAREDRAMAVVFITHNLGVVASIADTVCVMYAGHVVEYGRVFDVFEQPLHPYTRALLAVCPRLDGPQERLRTVPEIIAHGGPQGMELPNGRHAWWPHTKADPRSRPAALIQVEPTRWVAADAQPGEDAPPPDIPWRRGDPARILGKFG